MSQNNYKIIAIIGSRGITTVDLERYLPPEINEIVSGGAKGIDMVARDYATKNNIKLTEFLPEYNKYGRAAPPKRNIAIIEYAHEVLVFWNGTSRGTRFVIDNCMKLGIPIKVYMQTELEELSTITKDSVGKISD